MLRPGHGAGCLRSPGWWAEKGEQACKTRPCDPKAWSKDGLEGATEMKEEAAHSSPDSRRDSGACGGCAWGNVEQEGGGRMLGAEGHRRACGPGKQRAGTHPGLCPPPVLQRHSVPRCSPRWKPGSCSSPHPPPRPKPALLWTSLPP